MANIFDSFTNLYSLSKTLRFELKPLGNTLENMRHHLRYDKDLQTFLADQEIEDAYQALKPIFDSLHEEFITDSLESETAKSIDFSKYLEKYRNKQDLKKNEKELRGSFSENWKKDAERIKENAGKNKKGIDILTENGYKMLTESGILKYIEKNIDSFVQIKSKEEIEKALESFKGFFTYFGGFNQNRENYYETGKEASTSVATRIVHENLPKFCDNLIQFECITKKKKNGTEEKIERKSEYLNAYKYLKDNEKTTQIKDAESGKMIEASVISEDIFKISYFSSCLSQTGIGKYNRIIGHYNLLINLYNQAKKNKEKDFKKAEKKFKELPKFKTLWKQIGCGKRDPLFFSLTHDTKIQAQENKEKCKKPYSVEQILEQAKIAGEKYFQGKSDDGVINTIPEFLEYLLKKESYDGVYWSKAAMNTISNKYFANYHTLKDHLKKAKVFQKAANGSEEEVKIPDAIELSELFPVFDEVADWKTSMFLNRILEDEKKAKIIQESQTPSEALLKMIFNDIEENAKQFLGSADKILGLKEYKSEDSKETIKAWMDHALAINQVLKYFLVKENKAKGTPVDPVITEALNVLLRADDAEWFKWYDALRNYLTKKPQDDAKENKLKLNFECPSLLGGWSDGQEKNKAAVLLKKDEFYYLGILVKKNIFDTDKQEDNKVYKNSTLNAGRLILANLKFQTLAGKGFGVGEESYGNVGKKDPMKAVVLLQKFIKDRYIKKYPLLKRIADSHYSDKKTFDKDIQETLKKCYVCEFTPINWERVEEYTDSGEMYLFQIYSKDFAKKSTGNKNMQTLYWSAVFEKNSPFQLSGGGEIFYRKQAIKEKKVKTGYEKKPWVVEGKRFTDEDGKFFFHCPIKINYKAKSYPDPKYAIPEINKLINKHLSVSTKTCFLGIDRGEKHLAYYSLVDRNGNIVIDADGKAIHGTLNMPFVDKDGKPRSIKKEKYFYDKKEEKWKTKEVDCWNYNDLLDAMASNRDMARKNWQTIGTIKELKAGYISQVVRKIANLAIAEDKPAFIVLEDLNTGFKRERQKIEKSVYQKFELALAKKLNFLVDKSKKNGEIGSVTNALQLTPPVTNYGDIENRKQIGIMLYTRANYTSQTDPITGWRKSIYLKAGSEESIRDQIIENFSDVCFDGKDYVFAYVDRNTGKKWKLYSGKDGKRLDRFRGKKGKDKNEWTVEEQDIMEILNGVFAKFDNDKRHSLLSQIKEGKELTKVNNYTAWESLRFAVDLIQQMRNTGVSEQDNDFILSPVRDKQGNHFDSRKATEKQPNSGDANGAYNIARKGIIMNEHIKQDLKLFIADAEWDTWLAGREIWEKWINDNKSNLLKEKKKEV